MSESVGRVRSMRSKIEEIDARLKNIVTDKKDLELRENTGGRTRTTRSRVPTTSLENKEKALYPVP
ncbi:hypothetical protein CFP56_018158 [Quercus suber]|uniref:Uncharacterized protein n=1 Tax=Quercus suber TaxID=58331 RepID=A0AAW0KLJ5_QUESU